jgi:hypothetical protein
MTQTTNPFHAPMSFSNPAADRAPRPVYVDPARYDIHTRFAPKTLMLPPPPPPPGGRRRRAGAVAGMVVAALGLLTGLAILLLGLFGTPSFDASPLKRQIVETTRSTTGMVPRDVVCPSDERQMEDPVFGCTATLDGQTVHYTVTHTDDNGSVTFTSDAFVKVDDVAKKVSADMARKSGVGVGATCDAGGRTVIVGGKGTSFPCTVTNAQDPSDSVTVTATITDDKGTVTYAVND